jgi:hypothetical protein
VDAEHVDEPGRELVIADEPAGALTVTPEVTAGDLVARLAVIKDAMEHAMTPDIDYGVIPGATKPSLLKPGSEKLGVLFQLDIQLDNEKIWGPEEHLTVISRAVAYHAPSGTRLGFGEGVCTTKERKYAYRRQERTCPQCGKAAIIKGKAEYGGGWVCFKKKNGCGAKFADGDSVIESQVVGEIGNPDLPDTWNTVVKMAEKRARIDAVLAVTGASALFTQDLEDQPSHQGSEPPTGAAAEHPNRDERKTPAAASEETVTRDQYASIVAAFRDAGAPVEALAEHLGCEPTSAAVAAFCTPEAGHLTKQQAAAAIKFLRGLKS